MHNDPHTILVFITSICCILVLLLLIYHYTKNLTTPSDAWVLISGLCYGIIIKQWDIQNLPRFNLDPHIIILVILPILIFISSRLINVKDLNSNAIPISFFATIGVVATSFLIGAPLALMLGIPLLDTLLIGAAVGATDPAAVGAIFHRFNIPERLGLIVEGESLFNDGTTVVLFGVIGGLLFNNQMFSLIDSISMFIWAVVAPLPLGILLGWLAAKILNQWNEQQPFYSISTGLIVTYSSFLIAEELLHISGVIAVLITTVTFCRYRNLPRSSNQQNGNSSIENQRSIDDFWHYIALITNGILFFSLGVTVGLHDFNQLPLLIVAGAIIALVIARCILIYGGSFLLSGLKQKIPFQWQNILVLGGLRGAISAALVLTIPHEYEHREIFLCLVMAMIAFTLIIQPTVLKYYLDTRKITDSH